MEKSVFDLAFKGLCDLSRAADGKPFDFIDEDGDEEVSETGRDYVNRLAIVIDRGLQHTNDYWCASYLCQDTPISAVVSMTCYEHATPPVSRARRAKFFDWLCNRSPYAQCIVTKSGDFAAIEGVILDGDFPANLVVGAIVASRIVWEATTYWDCMEQLIDAGMNESAAFFMAHSIRVLPNGEVAKRQTGNHLALAAKYTGKETLINFCNGTMINPNGYLSSGEHYRGIDVMWGDMDDFKGGKSDLIKEARLYAAAKAYKKEAVFKIPNPFARSLNLNSVAEDNVAVSLTTMVEYVNNLLGDKVCVD